MSILRQIIKGTVLCTALVALPLTAETVIIKGSDTLGAKLIPLLAESFRAEKASTLSNISFEIAAEGSSTGIASIIEGTTDIGMSSRELAPLELSQARAKKVAIAQIQIARDSLAVVVHPTNSIDGLSMQDIENLFCGDIQNWAGVSLQTGNTSVYVRNSASGTYRAFSDLALSGRDYGQEVLSMAGNEQIAEEIANNTHSIGYVGFAYADRLGLKILSIDGIMPQEPDYALSRPLYFLINQNNFKKPIAREFVDFVLSPKGQAIVESVYFLPATAARNTNSFNSESWK